MRIKGSPLISCLKGPLGGPNSPFYYYTRKGLRIVPRRKKRTGGGIVKTRIWKDVQYCWHVFDEYWMALTPQQKGLWQNQAKRTHQRPRSGLDYFKSVNIRRWYVGFPPITDPPARPQSIKRRFDNTMPGYEWMPQGKVQPVWVKGKKKPEENGETFDETTGQEDPPQRFTITSTSGPNGSIAPEGTHLYPQNANVSFAMSPDPGYEGDKLFIDDVEQAFQATYTFYHLLENHTIHVTWKALPPSTITIISSSDAGGTIDPDGEHEYEIGTDVTFEITLGDNALGCIISTDLEDIPWQPEYTFENVQENHWITVYNRPVEIEVYLYGYAFGWCFGVVCTDLNFETFPITWAEAPQRWWGTHPNAGECILTHTGPPWDEWQLTVGNWIGVPIACFTQPDVYTCTPPHTGWTVEDCCCDDAGNPGLELRYWGLP